MTDQSSRNPQGQPGHLEAAFFGCCPDCGARTLFDGVAAFAPRCRACGLDFSKFNVGDGPAAFLTLAIGALVTILAVSIELSAGPPWWVHALIWPPFTALLVVGGLRVTKAWLLQAEYRNSAREAGMASRSSVVGHQDDSDL